MNVVFANNYYYLRGGSERVFFDEMELLRAGRHRVAPFSRKFEKNHETEYARYFAPPLEYEHAPLIRKVTAGVKLIYSRECGRAFQELLTRFNPDIVHAHNIYGRLTTSVIDAAKAKNIPVVMTLHDYKLLCPSYLMLSDGAVCDRCAGKSFFHCASKRCHKGSLIPSLVYTAESYFNSWFRKYEWPTALISPSRFLLKKLLEAGVPGDKLVHIPNFIKVEKITPAYTSDGSILFAGRLSKEKGVLTLLQAVQGLAAQVNIVGDGPMRPVYEAYAREHGISNVTFKGYRSGGALESLFQKAAFVVFPSEWYENAPMTILESFAYGKPVIGSNIGGIPEMVIDQTNGLLFEPGNFLDLRRQIEHLIERPSLTADMGKHARLLVEERYNAEKHYRQLLDVYREATR